VSIPGHLIRGVQNTAQRPSLESLVDWCAFTVPGQNALEEVFSVIGIPLQSFFQMPKGRLGYRNQHRCGHIVVYSGGMPRMGIHVEMTGQGCRQFDASFGRWRDLISKVLAVDGHFTRIDVAIDDKHGILPFAEACKKYRRHEVRTKFKRGAGYVDVTFSADPENDGHTLYFGKAKSDIKIRIYDKAAEQGVEGAWIRTELECRRGHANKLAKRLCDTSNQCAMVAGILKNYVTFVEPLTNDTNKARWPTSPWWDNFLGSVGKLSLSTNRNKMSCMKKVEAYLFKQASAYLALMVKYNGGDMSCLEKFVEYGATKLKPHHLAMLAFTGR
jgi:phage replication initiation protein